MTLAGRFWSKVDIRSAAECWPWLGAKNSATGRGQIRVGGRGVTAPRIAWAVTFGDPPSDLNILHRCDNPNCVNPSHLWLGSQRENIRDAVAKGRMKSVKTHCPYGHPYSGGNLYTKPNGWRICRTCAKAYRKKWRDNHGK
jgi:hypothetical protein